MIDLNTNINDVNKTSHEASGILRAFVILSKPLLLIITKHKENIFLLKHTVQIKIKSKHVYMCRLGCI